MYLSGGLLGGWHHKDHDVFLRVWTQCLINPTSINPTSSVNPTSSFNPTSSSINPTSSVNPTSQHSINPTSGSSTLEGENKQETKDSNDTILTLNYPQYTITINEQNKIIRKLFPLLSHIDELSIIQHIQWYLIYISLLDAKKALIQSWRNEQKKNEKGQNYDPFSADGAENGENSNINMNLEAALYEASGGERAQLTNEERLVMREKVQKWKESKEEAERRRIVSILYSILYMSVYNIYCTTHAMCISDIHTQYMYTAHIIHHNTLCIINMYREKSARRRSKRIREGKKGSEL